MFHLVSFRIPTGSELARMSPEELKRTIGRIKATHLTDALKEEFYFNLAACLRLHTLNVMGMPEGWKTKFNDLFANGAPAL